ncbi:hypothetical protein PI87_17630 [Ralstonia sp. A12]|uniref:hypothetical protein n=1 Tax=Ralstonia sp. A12 TaxID=1217052 RepID=UPI000573869E|nr:hypothetical protein [Ralstonia sp. A12]KHK53656.1 hypothetical protein PI87_17630 [Ralstonia sp. A12]
MKTLYLAVGLAQLVLILASGLLRSVAWDGVDLSNDVDNFPPLAYASFYAFIGWGLTIPIAGGLAIWDKKNRSMIVLFLVALLPSAEFFLWLFAFF